ncbi:MAG: SPOR domain-containing protein [Pseudomonadota bacterium]
MKQRMVGAAVLVALAVIFIPILFDGAGREQVSTPIPAAPPEPTLPDPIPLQNDPIVLKDIAESITEPEDSESAAKPVAAGVDTGDLSAWVVQLGSFSDRENADALVKALQGDGFAAYLEPLERDGSVSHRVRIGPEMTREKAETIRNEVANRHGSEGVVMRYRGPDAEQ